MSPACASHRPVAGPRRRSVWSFALPQDLYCSLEVDTADVAFTNVLLATAVGGPSHDVSWRLRPGERRTVRVRLTVAPWAGWGAVEDRYRGWDGCVDRAFAVAPRARALAPARLSPWPAVQSPAPQTSAAPASPSGLALSRRLFEVCGRSLLEELGLLDRCAVVCLGGASQNAGLDDETSRDHWWGPYLTFLLPDAAGAEHRDRLERLKRAVAELRDEVDGVSWVGYGGPAPRRTRVSTFLQFLRELTGLEGRPRSDREWLPHLTRTSFLGRRWTERLFDATQGAVLHDPGGRFTELWRHWTGYVPPGIHRALLARSLFRVWSAGPEYNLARLHRRDDRLGFRLCLARFADEVLELAFCWNERFVPQPKWRVAHFRSLPIRPLGVTAGLDALWDAPEPDAQLAAAETVMAEIKLLMRDLYHVALSNRRPMSAYAQAIHKTIGDPEVRRGTPLDW